MTHDSGFLKRLGITTVFAIALLLLPLFSDAQQPNEVNQTQPESVLPEYQTRKPVEFNLNQKIASEADQNKTVCVQGYQAEVNKFAKVVFPDKKFTTQHFFNPSLSKDQQNQCIIKEISFDNKIIDTQAASHLNTEIRKVQDPAKLTDAKYKGQSQDSSWAVDWLAELLSGIVWIISWVISWLTTFLGGILNFVLYQTAGAGLSIIVDRGWRIVRDTMNMFFILALIAIALGTILRLKEYSEYKHLIGKLILMALLINFSKAIAMALIGLSDFVTQAFVNNDNFSQFYAAGATFTDLDYGQSNIFANIGSTVVQAISAVFFTFYVFAAYAAVTVLFVVRYVGLTVLIILSPAIFALSILPGTEKYAKEISQKFLKYLIWAPIAGFFLFLANGLLNFKANSGNATGNATFDFIVIGALFWAAVLVAQEAGMVGGKWVTDKAQGMAHGLSHGAADLFGRWYSSRVREAADKATKEGKTGKAGLLKTIQFLNPKVAAEAWKQRSKHKEEEAYQPAIGAAHDTLNRIMPTEWKALGFGTREYMEFNEKTGKMEMKKRRFMGRQTYNERVASEGVINKRAKEFNEANLSEEERVELYMNATESADKQALFKSLIANRHEDGLGITRRIAENAHKPPQAQEHEHYDTVEELDRITQDLSEHGRYSDDQIGEQLAHMVEMSEESKKLRGVGLATFEWDRKFRAANDFSGIRKMAKIQGDQAMIDYLKRLGILDDQNRFINGKTGQSTGWRINSLQDFERVLQSTSANDKDTGVKLKYELTGARMAAEANKRIQRGDTEDWGKAIEPAAFLQQNVDGSWGDYTAYGRRMMKQLSPATIKAFVGSRRFQARSLRIIGINQFQEGPDKGKLDTVNINWGTMVETSNLNPEAAAAILEKSNLPEAEANRIVTELNRRLGGTHEFRYDPGRKEVKLLR